MNVLQISSARWKDLLWSLLVGTAAAAVPWFLALIPPNDPVQHHSGTGWGVAAMLALSQEHSSYWPDSHRSVHAIVLLIPVAVATLLEMGLVKGLGFNAIMLVCVWMLHLVFKRFRVVKNLPH